MKNIIALAALAAQAAFPAAALAVTVDYGGSINVNDVQVQVTPGGVNVQTGTGAGTGTNVKVNTGTGGVQVQTGGSTIILRDSSGTAVSVNAGIGSLDVVVAGGLDAESRGAIVSLEGNSLLLIKSRADLEAYANLIAAERASITAANIQKGHFIVRYRQPARLLGIVPSSLAATVDVDTDGTVTIQTPWYGFLFTKNTDTVRAKVAADVAVEVTAGRLSATPAANTTVSVRNDARVLNVVTSSIDGSVSVSAE